MVVYPQAGEGEREFIVHRAPVLVCVSIHNTTDAQDVDCFAQHRRQGEFLDVFLRLLRRELERAKDRKRQVRLPLHLGRP